MSWVHIALLAALFPMGLVLVISAVMWFVQKEEAVIERSPDPEPTRAVTFDRNIPGKGSSGSE